MQTGKGYTEAKLIRGQFAFGRLSASKELNMKSGTVVKRMMKLKNMGNITIQPHTHYSVITICNWDTYQCNGDTDVTGTLSPKEQARNTQGTGKEHIQEVLEIKEGKEEIQKHSRPKKKCVYSDADRDMVLLLVDLMNQNKPDRKQESDAVKKKWADECRRMREIDNRSIERIDAVIRWALADSFWFDKIQSFGKLREKFDQLESRMREKRVARYGEERPNFGDGADFPTDFE
jgi:hypothetical protein